MFFQDVNPERNYHTFSAQNKKYKHSMKRRRIEMNCAVNKKKTVLNPLRISQLFDQPLSKSVVNKFKVLNHKTELPIKMR